MNIFKALIAFVWNVIAFVRNGWEFLRFGGLRDGSVPSPYQVVDERPMYRLRHYFPERETEGPVALLVPALMMTADVFDIDTSNGPVAMLNRAGVDPWVVDFGSPAIEEDGWQRDMADHVLAVVAAIDSVRERTGQDVHLVGFCQGGMFCYQAAAYRRTDGIASVVGMGTVIDFAAGLPFGTDTAGRIADWADGAYISNRVGLTWFNLIAPVNAVKFRIGTLRQLHDREAMLPNERLRRFIAGEGRLGHPGPALADLMRQFGVHNRLLLGGFVIRDQVLSLAQLTCPILAVVGLADTIAPPAAVRGIKRAASRAPVYELNVAAGHYNLAAGEPAETVTWPNIVDWLAWQGTGGQQPDLVHEMADPPETPQLQSETLLHRLKYRAPRQAKLGVTLPRRTISLGRVIADRAPNHECLLYDGRVQTYGAVNAQIDTTVRVLIGAGIQVGTEVGVVAGMRPASLVALAALSRIGAVPVLLPTDHNLTAAIELTAVETVVSDPEYATSAAEAGARVLLLRGDECQTPEPSAADSVLDLEGIDPQHVRIPDWFQPNPGTAREIAFIFVTRSATKLQVERVTNRRWALSAFAVASSVDMTASDTVSCLASLNVPSGLFSAGGAIVSGARMAFPRESTPAQYWDESLRYGVTVVARQGSDVLRVSSDQRFGDRLVVTTPLAAPAV